MKKILLFSAFFSGLCSCKTLHRVESYTNTFGNLWTKPVSIDTTSLDENKTYVIEGYLNDGNAVLFEVKVPILLQVLRIKWPENGTVSDYVKGYAFTINDLGKESILSRNELRGDSKYDLKQQGEFLERNRFKRKYELVSALPFKVVGEVKADKIVVLKAKTWSETSGAVIDRSSSLQPNTNLGTQKKPGDILKN